jgi:hypothetical protein
MMIAALIAAASLVALLPLCVSYCGTVLSSARKVEISERVTALIGARDKELSAEDFERILQLIRLCPEVDADRGGVRAVATYDRLLHVSEKMLGPRWPSLAAWTQRERRDCSHFAAVVLDRSISASRSRFTQEASDPL